jgi:hypothetical protein
MFGGIGFMIDGHMAVGVSGEGGLMIHCSKEETEALLAKPGARPFEMRGREMKGWLRVDAESVSTKRALEPWAMQSGFRPRGCRRRRRSELERCRCL